MKPERHLAVPPRPPRSSFPAPALVALAAFPWLLAAPLAAQDDGDLWAVEGEVAAALFFGNTRQTTFTSRASVETSDERRELGLDVAYGYGEATDDAGDAFVSKRSWRAAGSLDLWPESTISPFFFGGGEGSFERRIDLRWDVGGGAKWVIRRSEGERLDLSVALLAEQTDPSPLPGSTEEPEDDLLARGSVRLRLRRTLAGGRVTLNSENRYQPRVDDFDDFTFTSTSSAAFQLSDRLSLKLTFIDNYDARAVERGARTNNDGQLLLGVLSTF